MFYDNEFIQQAALSLQHQLREVLGLECVINCWASWDKFFQKFNSDDFQIGLINWVSAVVDDPIFILSGFRYTGGLNVSRWSNTEFQKLLDLSDDELNPFVRSSLLLQAEEVLSREVPIIPLFYQPYQALVNRDIEGLLPKVFWISKMGIPPIKKE